MHPVTDLNAERGGGPVRSIEIGHPSCTRQPALLLSPGLMHGEDGWTGCQLSVCVYICVCVYACTWHRDRALVSLISAAKGVRVYWLLSPSGWGRLALLDNSTRSLEWLLVQAVRQIGVLYEMDYLLTSHTRNSCLDDSST